MLVEVTRCTTIQQYPTQCEYWTPRPRLQNFRTTFRRSRKPETVYIPDTTTPGHQNTTIANQAYTFNGTTPNASVSYAPETFNMGAPFSTYQQVLYNQQQNHSYTQKQQYRNIHLWINKTTRHHSQTKQHSLRNYNSCYKHTKTQLTK